jgi:myotubularin-related protein 1/2
VPRPFSLITTVPVLICRYFGVLVVTNYRVVFKDYRNNQIINSVPNEEIPLGSLSHVEVSEGARVLTTVQRSLSLFSKDYRSLSLGFPGQSSEEQGVEFVAELVSKMSFPEAQSDVFAFGHKAQLKPTQGKQVDGWSLFSAEKEFERQGWDFSIPNHPFRLFVNGDYQYCSSYPDILIVPSHSTDEDLKKVCNFRSKGRLPSVTWRHPKTDAVIARCSQPMTGLTQKRCEADEKLLREIRRANPTNSRVLRVVDCRPMKVPTPACFRLQGICVHFPLTSLL